MKPQYWFKDHFTERALELRNSPRTYPPSANDYTVQDRMDLSVQREDQFFGEYLPHHPLDKWTTQRVMVGIALPEDDFTYIDVPIRYERGVDLLRRNVKAALDYGGIPFSLPLPSPETEATTCDAARPAAAKGIGA